MRSQARSSHLTIGLYMRTVFAGTQFRSITGFCVQSITELVKDGYVEQTNPFEAVYTGVDVTRKRALPVEMLHQIAAIKLQDPELGTVARFVPLQFSGARDEFRGHGLPYAAKPPARIPALCAQKDWSGAQCADRTLDAGASGSVPAPVP